MPFAPVIARSNGNSERSSERGSGRFDVQERSPYAIAQDGLAELVGASVHAQRVEAMNAAMRVDLIFLTVTYALRAEQAFVAPTLSPARRREMAHRSVTAELATALHVPERTMQRQIDDAWALSTQLPATLSALRSGSLSLQHARVIVDAAAELDGDPRVRADLDEQLARFAADHTAATVRRKARSLREELQAQSLAERHRAARAKRRVEIEPALDGMTWLHALLPAAEALLIKDRLDRVAHEVDAASHAASRATFAAHAGHGSERAGHAGSPARTEHVGAEHDRHGARVVALTSDQVRADALRDLLLYGALGDDSAFAAACGRVRPSVHVTVPVLTLMGSSADPGLLDGYGPIDAETARRLAADAPSFIRLLTDPVTGTVLDVDRNSYRPPADLKRWLQVRDGTCRFPGCNRGASRSDLDHSVDWNDAGRTAFDNLAHLCPLHHHLKHETSWSMRHLDGAVLEWTSPSGRVHRTYPARTKSNRIDRDDAGVAHSRDIDSPKLGESSDPPDLRFDKPAGAASPLPIPGQKAAAHTRFADAPPF